MYSLENIRAELVLSRSPISSLNFRRRSRHTIFSTRNFDALALIMNWFSLRRTAKRPCDWTTKHARVYRHPSRSTRAGVDVIPREHDLPAMPTRISRMAAIVGSTGGGPYPSQDGAGRRIKKGPSKVDV